MKPIPLDYVPPESDFEQFKDGEYFVIAARWSSLDDQDRPILVAQKDGRLVVRAHLLLEGKDDGPPYSCSLREVPLLVRAFGGDVNRLPPVPAITDAGAITSYLEKAEELLVSQKPLKVVVSNGWVNSVEGMEVPPGLFYFRICDITPHNKDGEPEPKQGQYGPIFFLHLEIVAGEGGSKTPWEGAVTRELMNYAIETRVGEDGVLRPDWQRRKGGDSAGAYTKAATILAHLMQYTAPVLFQDGYIHSNPNNLLPDWKREALKTKAVFKGYRAKADKSAFINLKWATVEPVASGGFSSSAPVQSSSAVRVDYALIDTRARILLKQLMSTLAGEDAFIGDSDNWTDAGKRVAKQWLSPLKQQQQIPGVFRELTFEHVQRIFEYVRKEIKDEAVLRLVDVLYDKLLAVGIHEIPDSEF